MLLASEQHWWHLERRWRWLSRARRRSGTFAGAPWAGPLGQCLLRPLSRLIRRRHRQTVQPERLYDASACLSVAPPSALLNAVVRPAQDFMVEVQSVDAVSSDKAWVSLGSVFSHLAERAGFWNASSTSLAVAAAPCAAPSPPRRGSTQPFAARGHRTEDSRRPASTDERSLEVFAQGALGRFLAMLVAAAATRRVHDLSVAAEVSMPCLTQLLLLLVRAVVDSRQAPDRESGVYMNVAPAALRLERPPRRLRTAGQGFLPLPLPAIRG